MLSKIAKFDDFHRKIVKFDVFRIKIAKFGDFMCVWVKRPILVPMYFAVFKRILMSEYIYKGEVNVIN